jgi:hypothetical protein
MFHPDQVNSGAFTTDVPATTTHGTRGCLQEGCPCRDARIVSHRRAAFFAAIARANGETADRVIAPDPEWQMPTGDLA